MLSTERPQFEEQLAVLCAGCNVPATPERNEAYWRGLLNMNLIAFGQVVDAILGGAANAELGDKGRGKIPTVPQIWSIYHQLRNQRRVNAAQAQDKPVELDRFGRFANFMLLNFIRRYPVAISDASLREMVKVKDRLVDDFREIDAEDPVSGEDMRNALHRRWNNLVRPASEQERRLDREYLEIHHSVRTKSGNEQYAPTTDHPTSQPRQTAA